MSKATSIRLTEQAEAALAFLKTRLGSFNLQSAVNQIIVEDATKQGWRSCNGDKEI